MSRCRLTSSFGASSWGRLIAVVNQPEGLHAFDLYQDSAMSREVVRSVLAFLRSHLSLDRISG